MIPQADLRAALLADEPEISEVIERVKRSGWFILGPEVEAFEHEFAAWIGARHAVGVANGTDAIALALKACGVGPGTSVVTVSHTVSATVAAVEQVGATPILIDVSPSTLTMETRDLEQVLASRKDVRAVLPVHIYGQAANLAYIRKTCDHYGVALVDDCAHAFGASIGDHCIGSHYADISCFSFYPTKNLACLGDGGCITTNDAILAERVRSLRQYCWGDQRYVSTEPGGVDSRLDELQAAILRVRLRKLDARQERREWIAMHYDDETVRPVFKGNAHHLYVIRVPNRDRFRTFMRNYGISTNVHFPVPVHMQPAYHGRVPLGPSRCVETERAAREVVTLPLYPEMTDGQVEQVCEALREWGNGHG